jgi:tRNA (mo5U34)-methyltransferase
MTPEQIQEKIESLAPWFHCIDLGEGLKTKSHSAAGEPADHPADTWSKIKNVLPENLTGKSVLDVGCNAGFYAVEAKRRGASRVLGVDAQRHHVRQALFVRSVLDLDIEFSRMSVYDLNRQSVGQFDVTLALGLIYHCKHLVLALERLFEVTKELLILETAIMPLEMTPESFVDIPAGGEATLHPLVFAENQPEKKEQVFNWFLPSVNALKALLINVGFDEIDVADTKRDRAILVCRKTKPVPHGRVLSQLGGRITLKSGPQVCTTGSKLRFNVKAQNSGATRWEKTTAEGEPGIVRLGAHLLEEDGQENMWDYGRAPLEHDLEPGDESSLWIELTAPNLPGRYIVEFDMVLEHYTWFEDLGTRTILSPLEVRPRRGFFKSIRNLFR